MKTAVTVVVIIGIGVFVLIASRSRETILILHECADGGSPVIIAPNEGKPALSGGGILLDKDFVVSCDPDRFKNENDRSRADGSL